MEGNNRKTSKGLIVVIILLILIILGLIFYIVYDKGYIFKDVEVKENNTKKAKEKDEESLDKQISFDSDIVSKQLNDYVGSFLPYKYKTDMKNIDLLTSSDYRVNLLNWIFMRNSVKIYNDGGMQPFPYVSVDEYKNKYSLVYDSTSNLEVDLRNSIIQTNMEGFRDKIGFDFISWNNNWGSVSTDYILEVKNITYSGKNKNYILDGTYQQKDNVSPNGEILSSGNFQIVYTKRDNLNRLVSITLS